MDPTEYGQPDTTYLGTTRAWRDGWDIAAANRSKNSACDDKRFNCALVDRSAGMANAMHSVSMRSSRLLAKILPSLPSSVRGEPLASSLRPAG